MKICVPLKENSKPTLETKSCCPGHSSASYAGLLAAPSLSAVPPHSALAHSLMNMPPAFSLPGPVLWLLDLLFSTSSPSSSSKLNNLHRWLVSSELLKNTGQWNGVQKEPPEREAALPTQPQAHFVISSLQVRGQWAERLAGWVVECLFNTLIL